MTGPSALQLAITCFALGIIVGIGLSWLVVIRAQRQTINQLSHAFARTAEQAKELADRLRAVR